jgi:hypothetical protein
MDQEDEDDDDDEGDGDGDGSKAGCRSVSLLLHEKGEI